MDIKNIDYDLEVFYINFKQSMINFYQNKSFSRPINQWSERLNVLQKNKDYENIYKLIIKIISLYSIDLMRMCDDYHTGILETNIKRFNRVSKKTMADGKYTIDLISYKKNVVFLLFDIFRYIIKNEGIDILKPLFIQVELYLLYEDYTPLIEYAINNNKLNILDKLFKFSNKNYKLAFDLYLKPLNIIYKKEIMSGKKFVELLKNKK
tara:strand:+ start:74 stop:697 length:624 start_codon:yes stop_codon:yes gene_type:complete